MSLLDLEHSSVLQAVQISGQPAAGAEWTALTVPVGESYKLESIFCTFTTSAVVSNRQPRVQITDGANVIYESCGGTNYVASGTYRLSWGRLVPVATTAGSSTTSQFTLPDLWLPPGYTIASNTFGKDVADQYSVVRGIIRVSTADYS